MSLGTMTWTCLLLSAAAAPPDLCYMPKAFQIPIRFDPQKRAEIGELDLWVSSDKGQSWTWAGRAKPDQDHFDYAVAEDGQYWFTMEIVYKNGRHEPANVKTAPPGQRVIVDTARPDIKLEAARQGDQVHVSWKIWEANPNPETLKLEYAASMEGPWTAVPIKPGPDGQADIRDASAVVVRMKMQDLAENEGLAVKQVPAVVGAALSPPPPPPPSDPPPPPLRGAATGDRAADVSQWTARSQDAPPPPTPPPAGTGPSALDPPPPPPTPTPGPSAPLAVAPKVGANQPAAFSPVPGPGPLPPPGPPLAGQDLAAPGRGETPSLQIVNHRQIKLEFDVGKFGPSGLGGVDLYVTTDDGATWQQAAVDPHAVTLPAADIRAGGSIRASLAVQLLNEGVTYGYFVVAKSKAGLGRPAPKPGDAPQIRIELDTTLPEARIDRIEANPARPDTLTLWWTAKDKHIAVNPVTLEWSASAGPDAQWNPIGPPEMENAGHYDWQPGPEAPPNVYLRLTVRDTAGNRAVAQSKAPVLIDLSVPEVTNIGLGGAGPNIGPH